MAKLERISREPSFMQNHNHNGNIVECVNTIQQGQNCYQTFIPKCNNVVRHLKRAVSQPYPVVKPDYTDESREFLLTNSPIWVNSIFSQILDMTGRTLIGLKSFNSLRY